MHHTDLVGHCCSLHRSATLKAFSFCVSNILTVIAVMHLRDSRDADRACLQHISHKVGQ